MNDMLRIIEPMIPSLRRYARALVRNHATADDLVQDCLERAVSRWHQRRNGEDARPWIFTILHNLAVNHFRETATRGAHISIDEADQNALGLEAVQEQRLLYREVMQRLAGLPDEQRSVILLVAVEDMSYADAARVLGVPVGTVMSRLSRARERLHQEAEGRTNAASQKVTPLRSIK
jgi:RNA polymerase sigma-70 factor (ECF subfamily)